MKVDNKRQGSLTIEGHVLQPGVGEIPSELRDHWYVKALVEAEELTILESGDAVVVEGSPYTGPVAGDPVLDENGEPTFDENGEPILYVAEE